MLDVLDNIPFKLEPEQVIKQLGIRSTSKQIESMVEELTNIAVSIAKPKAVYRVAFVSNKEKSSLEIDGITFESKLVRVQLEKVNRVFPYLATCGTELDSLTVESSDTLKAFCLDTIKSLGVVAAISYLSNHIQKRYNLGQMSHMNPGSIENWPLEQQKTLFSLFPNVEELTGIQLSKGYVMHPLKSVSGVYYPTEIRFESCQLCPREKCTGRRAPYSPEMAAEYQQQSSE